MSPKTERAPNSSLFTNHSYLSNPSKDFSLGKFQTKEVCRAILDLKKSLDSLQKPSSLISVRLRISNEQVGNHFQLSLMPSPTSQLILKQLKSSQTLTSACLSSLQMTVRKSTDMLQWWVEKRLRNICLVCVFVFMCASS